MHKRSRRPEISVVMPCLNEADTVGGCIREARKTIARAGLRGEVVIADNGSTDGSISIATAAGARVVNATIRGYGAALRRGISAARGRFILMADADRSYDLTSLPKFVDKLREGFDLVQGSRLRGTIVRGAMPFSHRWFGTPLFNFLLRILFGVRVSDSQCGMRAFSRKTFASLGLSSPGMEFASEMLVKAARANLRIAEVPIRYRPDGRRRPPHLRTFVDGWRHLRLMMLLGPVSLLLVPGVAFFTLGTALIGASLVHMRILGHPFDFHFAILGSALVLIGYQVAHLGVGMALLRRGNALRPSLRFLTKALSLERILIWGSAIGLVGLGMDLRVLFYWLAEDVAAFSKTMTLVGILGTTLILLSVEIVLGGLFLASLIGLESEQNIAG